MTIDNKIEIDASEFADNFRLFFDNVDQAINYIKKTNIIPIIDNTTCINIKSAYEQAHNNLIDESSELRNKGCLFCGGKREYIPCRSFTLVKNPDLLKT